MGDPRKTSNKFETPRHPWQKDRIDFEKPLMKEYGLKNKREIWKAGSKLKNFKDTAKALVARTDTQSEKERTQLVTKLKSLNLITSNDFDEILGLELNQLLDRRLQTILFKKGLARSVQQARQMITHKHVTVNGKMITAPGYLIRLNEENSIGYVSGSTFEDPDHPERKPLKKEAEEITKVTKSEAKKEESKVETKKETKSETKKEEPKSETKEGIKSESESKKKQETESPKQTESESESESKEQEKTQEDKE
ncbi:30S ribosomal protein S4 [Candidatus Woesearchaeota archaeon]|nr:30S ribosomal protein S4 [Candidatus Woesearchaeota archaeon]